MLHVANADIQYISVCFVLQSMQMFARESEVNL